MQRNNKHSGNLVPICKSLGDGALKRYVKSTLIPDMLNPSNLLGVKYALKTGQAKWFITREQFEELKLISMLFGGSLQDQRLSKLRSVMYQTTSIGKEVVPGEVNYFEDWYRWFTGKYNNSMYAMWCQYQSSPTLLCDRIIKITAKTTMFVDCEECEASEVVVCPFCGMLNHMMEEEKTHCGACFGDLEWDFECGPEGEPITTTIMNLLQGHYGMAMLEQLSLSNYLDLSALSESPVTPAIVNHDLMIIKQLLSRTRNQMVPIPSNVSKSELSSIKFDLGTDMCCPRHPCLNGARRTVAEISWLVNNLRQGLKHEPHNHVVLDKMDLLSSVALDDQPYVTVDDLHSLTREEWVEVKHLVLILPNGRDMTEALNNKSATCQVTCISLNMDEAYYKEEWDVATVAHTNWASPLYSSATVEFGTDVKQLLSGERYTILASGKIVINSVLQRTNMLVMSSIKQSMKVPGEVLGKIKSCDLEKVGEFTIPIVDVNALLGKLGVPVLEEKTVSLDRTFLRYLINKNLLGNMTYADLLDYAISLCHSRYVLDGRERNFSRISADDCRVHCYVCIMICRLNKSEIHSYVSQLGPDNQFKQMISVLGMGAMQGLWSILIDTAKQYLSCTMETALTKTLTWMKTLSTNEFYSTDIWENIREWTFNDATVKQQYFVRSEWDSVEIVANCDHHNVECHHDYNPFEMIEQDLCTCCKLTARKENSTLCECCSISTNCHHDCEHLCTGKSSHVCKPSCSHDKKLCRCCKVATCLDVCPICNDHIPWVAPIIGVKNVLGKKTSTRSYAQPETSKKPHNKVTVPPKVHRDTFKCHGVTLGEKGCNSNALKTNKVKIEAALSKITKSELEMYDDDILANLGLYLLLDEQLIQEPELPDKPTLGDYMPAKTTDEHQVKPHDAGEESLSDAEISQTSLSTDPTIHKWLMNLSPVLRRTCVDGMLKCWGSLVEEYQSSDEIKPGAGHVLFCPEGTTYLDTVDWISIVNEVEIDGDDNLCGYHALKTSVPTCSLRDLREMSNKECWFSSSDLERYTKSIDVNLIILKDSQVTIFNHDSFNTEYALLIHHGDPTAGHWNSASFIQNKPLPKLPDWVGYTDNQYMEMWLRARGLPETTLFDDLTIDDRVRFTHSQVNEEEKLSTKTINDSLIAEWDGVTYKLTSKSQSGNNIRKGNVNLSIPEEFKDSLMLVNMEVNQIETSFEFNQPHSYSSDIPDDATQRIKQEVREVFKTIVQLGVCGTKHLPRKPIGYYDNVIKSNVKYLKDNVCRCRVSKDNIKTGDTICIQNKDKSFSIKRIVRTGKWMLFNHKIPSKRSPVKYHEPRTSLTSQLLKLSNLVRCKTSTADFKSLLKSSKAILAVPGWGKSTRIASQMDDDTTVVCVTSEAVRNLREMGVPTKQVTSVERACDDLVSTKKLVIDECTQVDWLRLFMLCGPQVSEIQMYGDSLQIGAVDFSLSSGERTICSCESYCGTVEQHNETHRFGSPLVDELKTLNPKLTSVAEHSTTVRVANLPDLDIERLTNLVKEEKPGVVLTFHQLTKTNLQKSLGRSFKVELVQDDFKTVHSFQGRQKARVMVVQHFVTPQGVHTDRRYLMSATTRCTNHLTWVTCGSPITSLKLADHLRNSILVGGGHVSIADTVIRRIESIFDVDKLLVNVRSAVDYIIGTYEENSDNQFEIKGLNNSTGKYEEESRFKFTVWPDDDRLTKYNKLIKITECKELTNEVEPTVEILDEEDRSNYYEPLPEWEGGLCYGEKTILYVGQTLPTVLLPLTFTTKFGILKLYQEDGGIFADLVTLGKTWKAQWLPEVEGFDLSGLNRMAIWSLKQILRLISVTHTLPGSINLQVKQVDLVNLGEIFDVDEVSRAANMMDDTEHEAKWSYKRPRGLARINTIKNGEVENDLGLFAIMDVSGVSDEAVYSVKLSMTITNYARLSFLADISHRFCGMVTPACIETPYGWVDIIIQNGCNPCAGLMMVSDKAWWVIDNDYQHRGARRVQFNELAINNYAIMYMVKTLKLEHCFADAVDQDVHQQAYYSVSAFGDEFWESDTPLIDFTEFVLDRIKNLTVSTLSNRSFKYHNYTEENNKWLENEREYLAQFGIVMFWCSFDELSPLNGSIMVGQTLDGEPVFTLRVDEFLFVCDCDGTADKLDDFVEILKVNMNTLLFESFKLGAKLRKNTITSLLRSANNAIFGGGDLEQGLILDLDQHKFHKTAVYSHLSQRLGEVKLRQSALVRRPFYHGRIVSQECRSQIMNCLRAGVVVDCPTVRATSTGSELVSLIMAHQLNVPITLVLKNPLLLISNSLWHCQALSLLEVMLNCTVASDRHEFMEVCGATSKKLMRSLDSYMASNKIKEATQLRAVLAKLQVTQRFGATGGNSLLKDINSQSKIMCVSHILLSEPKSLEATWKCDTNKIIVIVPGVHTGGSNWYRVSDAEGESMIVTEEGDERGITVSRSHMVNLMNQDTINLYGHPRSIKVIGSLLDYLIYECIPIESSRGILRKYWIRHPLCEMVRIPLLTTNLTGALQDKRLIKWVNLRCDPSIIRRLEIRCNRPNTTFKDLCEYGRTLLHSRDYSRLGSWDAVKIDGYSMLQHCQYAYYTSKNGDKSIRGILRILDVAMGGEKDMPLINWLRQLGLTKVLDQSLSLYNRIMQETGLNISLSQTGAELCGIVEALSQRSDCETAIEEVLTEYMPTHHKREVTFMVKYKEATKTKGAIGRLCGRVASALIQEFWEGGAAQPKSRETPERSLESQETEGKNTPSDPEPKDTIIEHSSQPETDQQSTDLSEPSQMNNLLMVSQGTRGDVEPLENLVNYFQTKFDKIFVLINRGNEEAVKFPEEVQILYFNMDGSDLAALTCDDSAGGIKQTLSALEKMVSSITTAYDQGASLEGISLIAGTSHTFIGPLLSKHYGVPFLEIQLFPWPYNSQRTGEMLANRIVSRVLEAVPEGVSHLSSRKARPRNVLLMYPPAALSEIDHNIGNSVRVLRKDYTRVSGSHRGKRCLITMGSITGSEALARYESGVFWAIDAGFKDIMLVGQQFRDLRAQNQLLKFSYLQRTAESRGVSHFTMTTYENYKEVVGPEVVVIHHGGAGTTNYMCRLNAKQIIMPIFNDQWYWASLLSSHKMAVFCIPASLPSVRMSTVDGLRPCAIWWQNLNHKYMSQTSIAMNELLSWVSNQGPSADHLTFYPYFKEAALSMLSRGSTALTAIGPVNLACQVINYLCKHVSMQLDTDDVPPPLIEDDVEEQTDSGKSGDNTSTEHKDLTPVADAVDLTEPEESGSRHGPGKPDPEKVEESKESGETIEVEHFDESEKLESVEETFKSHLSSKRSGVVLTSLSKPPLYIGEVLDWNTLIELHEQNLPNSYDTQHLKTVGPYTHSRLLGKKLENVTTLYDPKTSEEGTCVYDCLKYYLRNDKGGVLKTWSVLMRSRTWATLPDLIAFSLLARVKLILVRDEDTLIVNNKCAMYMSMRLTQISGLGHCSCVSIDWSEVEAQSWIGQEKFINAALVTKMQRCPKNNMIVLGGHNCSNHSHISKKTLQVLSNAVDVHTENDQVNDWIKTCSMVSGKTVKDLGARLSGSNWRHLIFRRKVQIATKWDHNYTNAISWDPNNCGFRPGDLLCAASGNGCSVGVLLNRSHDYLLPVSDTVGPVEFVLSLSMDLNSVKNVVSKVTKTVGVDKAVYLNHASMKYCQSIGLFHGDGLVVSSDATFDKLVISSFDNRPHHLSNEREVVKNCPEEKIVVVSEFSRAVTINWVKSATHLRCSIWHGNLFIEVESEDSVLLSLLDYISQRIEVGHNSYRWPVTGSEELVLRIVDTVRLIDTELVVGENNLVSLKRLQFRKGANPVKELKKYLIGQNLSAEGEIDIQELDTFLCTPPDQLTTSNSTQDLAEWLNSDRRLTKFRFDSLSIVKNTEIMYMVGPLLIKRKKLIEKLELVGGHLKKTVPSLNWRKMQDHVNAMNMAAGVKHGFKISQIQPDVTESRMVTLEKMGITDTLNNLSHMIRAPDMDNVESHMLVDNWLDNVCAEFNDLIVPEQLVSSYLDREPSRGAIQEIPIHVRDMWDDTSMLDWNTSYAPSNDLRLKASMPTGKRRTERKAIMTKYPIESRVVLTKAANQEFNALTGRVGNAQVIRKYNLNVEYEVKSICQTYFKPGWMVKAREYRGNPASPEPQAILSWLAEKPDCIKIGEELKMYMEDGFLTHPISDINVHIKLESLLKDDPVTVNEALKARVILWQAKGICAMFSSTFLEIKKRLKSLLRDEVVYTDGMQPSEISACLASVDTFTSLVEDDLTRQDSQTDKQTIDVEFGIYDVCGLDRNISAVWRRVHKMWRFKGKDTRGVWKEMRLTGQATTALGNAVVNLAVHWRLVARLGSSLKKFLLLGDDSLFINTTNIDATSLRRNIADYYNMKSKAMEFKNHGTFCSMVAYKTESGSVGMGPDFVRLKRRFEVPNGVSHASPENILARKLSYCMMLGAISPVVKLVKEMEWPITPTIWYDYGLLVNSLVEKYDISSTEVESYLSSLVDYLRSDTYYEVDFEVISQR
ncbi:polyprotein [Phytophthora endornavirus 3]|nr:polyprotein [Phytophthora endornavirus 3]